MKLGPNIVAAVLVAAGVCGYTRSGLAEEAARHNWTGFQLGVVAGKAWNLDGVAVGPANPQADFYFFGPIVPAHPIDHSAGGTFGGQVGYSMQTGLFVYGLEMDLTRTRIDDSAHNARAFVFSTTVVSEAKRSLDSLGSVRGRFGVTPFETTLLYVTGGLAFGRASLSNSVSLLDFTGTQICGSQTGLCAAGNTSKWLTGWTLGGGLEQAISANWTLRAEGLYYDLGSLSLISEDRTAPPPNDASFKSSADFKGQIFRVGVGYKFD